MEWCADGGSLPRRAILRRDGGPDRALDCLWLSVPATAPVGVPAGSNARLPTHASVHHQEQRLISTGDVKKGVIIELDGQLMKVLDWSHIKMARGSAQVRMKLQNVRRGDIVERTFQAGTRWPRARVEQRKAQYLYSDGDVYHFMDNETYDQVAISGRMLGDDARFLLENTEVFVSSHDGEVLGVDLPVTVDLRVAR